jgi:hypothetical protein
MSVEIEIDWSSGTFEGARREQLRQWTRLTLRERLEAMEELGELARFSIEEKRRRNRPYFDPYTDELVRG